MTTVPLNRAATTEHPGLDRARVTVEEYRSFRQDGFVICRGLIPSEDIAELREHAEALLAGTLPEQQPGAMDALPAPASDLSPQERARWVSRLHMLHRRHALHERYLLHSRVLDVMEVLVGPDVLALQTMLFVNPPGTGGQGWHQDTFYIPTIPDTLCGAWIAIDDADEYNGALWVAKGSHVEPVYPPHGEALDYGDRHIPGVRPITGASMPDEENDLVPIAKRYPIVLASVRAGDVVFFGGHTLHRSKRNITNDRFRRAFVSHYCNARSFSPWGTNLPKDNPHHAPAYDPTTWMSNVSHILARGDTHLPFAQPRFGTPCAATIPAERRRAGVHWMSMPAGNVVTGDMGLMPALTPADHD